MQPGHDVQEALGAIGERDHSQTAEYRIFGPPGCGKTTNLARQIRRAVDRFGEGSVLVTSFSRAAAMELAGRELPISNDRIGTLHSHCYHALGCPEIAEAQVDEWNRRNPHLRVTPAKKQGKLDGEETNEEESESQYDGDRWLQQLNRFRGMMLPRESWPGALREFAAKWEDYKTSLGLVDFCDLIETALHDLPVAPENPSVIFADEAQDLNRMQLTLIRKWGERARYFILAADDDQTIYSWCGAAPDAVLDPKIPEDHKIILKQSYRVPGVVHREANRLIRQVTRRQEKVYLPRPAEGVCERLSRGGYKSPKYGILKTAQEHLEQDRTVMFLASCAYMLQPVIAVLRKNGIPFHNPYRKSNGFWNPLRFGRKGSSANRVLALLMAHPDYGEGCRPWTHGDLKLWAECLTAKGILKPGVKAGIEQADPAGAVTIETLDQLFEPGALESLLAAFEGGYRDLLTWWRRRLTATFHSRVQFPIEVAMAGGPRALDEKPKTIAGTIHSVKGGEADVVFLFPDLSQAGDAAYQRFGPTRDSVIRLFYVGITRAREALYICPPEASMAAKI